MKLFENSSSVRIERRVETNEIDALVLDVLAKHLEIIGVKKCVHGKSREV